VQGFLLARPMSGTDLEAKFLTSVQGAAEGGHNEQVDVVGAKRI
jgi:hypothetical protein